MIRKASVLVPAPLAQPDPRIERVEKGKLALDAPINDYLASWQVPSYAFTEQRPVTLRHIMSHSAGFTVHGFPGHSAARPLPTVVQVLDGEPPSQHAGRTRGQAARRRLAQNAYELKKSTSTCVSAAGCSNVDR